MNEITNKAVQLISKPAEVVCFVAKICGYEITKSEPAEFNSDTVLVWSWEFKKADRTALRFVQEIHRTGNHLGYSELPSAVEVAAAMIRSEVDNSPLEPGVIFEREGDTATFQSEI